MIIDLILDRRYNIRYGYEDTYNPRRFYEDCREYATCFEDTTQWEIVDALDNGTNEEVQKALCKYLNDGGYNHSIKAFVNSMNWVEE